MTRAAYPSTGRPLRHARRPAAPPRTGRRRMALSTGLAGVLVLGSAGLASAYWRTTGSGGGSSQAATDLVLSASPVSVTGLYPGASQTVTVTVTASGGTAGKPITVTGVTPGTASVTGGSGGCALNAVTFAVTSGLPKTGTGSVVLNGTVSMSTGAANGCQSSTFLIPLTVNGKQ